MSQGIWETGGPSRPEYQMSQSLDDLLAAEHDRRMNPRPDR
jgi:hypothetical protein